MATGILAAIGGDIFPDLTAFIFADIAQKKEVR